MAWLLIKDCDQGHCPLAISWKLSLDPSHATAPKSRCSTVAPICYVVRLIAAIIYVVNVTPIIRENAGYIVILCIYIFLGLYLLYFANQLPLWVLKLVTGWGLFLHDKAVVGSPFSLFIHFALGINWMTWQCASFAFRLLKIIFWRQHLQ